MAEVPEHLKYNGPSGHLDCAKCSMKLNPLPWLFRRWLESELPKWSAAGVIRPDQQPPILDQYPALCADSARCAKFTLVTLAAIGLVAALVLTVASFWQAIPWGLKFGPVLLLMLAAHAGGYWYRFVRDATRPGDWLFLAGSLGYGLALLLIVARFESPAVLHACFAIWVASTLPLGLVLGSIPFLVTVAALSTAWFAALMLSPDSASGVYPLLVLMLIGFLADRAYRDGSRALMIVVILGLLVWWCMLPVGWSFGRQGVFWLAALGPILLMAALAHDAAHPFRTVFQRCGQAVAGLVSLGLALPSVALDLMEPTHTLRYWLLLVAGIGVAIVWATGTHLPELRRHWLVLAAAAAITVMPALVGLIGYELGGQRRESVQARTELDAATSSEERLAAESRAAEAEAKVAGIRRVTAAGLAAVFNAAAIAVGIGLILCGAARARASCIAAGAGYLAVWAIALSSDLANLQRTPLAALALVFTGAVLLATANYWARWRKRSHETVPGESA